MSGDKYEIGLAGSVGRSSISTGNTFQQIWIQKADDVDLEELAKELAILRGSLRNDEGDLERDEALGALASAQKAAATGDGPGALAALKRAGAWVLEAAKEIGVPVATKVLGAALGIPT